MESSHWRATEPTPGAVSRGSAFYAFRVSFVAAIGGFLFGYDLGVVVPASLYLKDQFQPTDAQLGFMIASATLGCILGPFLGGWTCDAFGRKRTMVIASILLAVSAIITALAQDLFTFNVFRVVGGVGVGLCSLASPMYIAELAPSKRRGRLGLLYQLAIVVSGVFSNFILYLIVRAMPENPEVWRWMFASEMGAILIFLCFVLALPNSPRWLAEKGRFDDAREVLARVGGSDYAQQEIRSIEQSLQQEKGGFGELFAPGLRYALLIGLLLAFFNQWTGSSAIGGYMAILFEMSGVEDRAVNILQLMLLSGLMAAVTVLSMFVVDLWGRRPLWIFGSATMIGVTFTIGLVFHYQLSGMWVLVVITLLTIPHGIALGPLPWLMMSEIFPTRIRAKAVAITTTFLWVAIFGSVQLFAVFSGISQRTIGSIGGAFWVLTVMCVASLFFGIFMLPETKGRTLEEIAESWKRN